MMRPYPFFGFPNFRRPYSSYYSHYPLHNRNIGCAKNEEIPCSPSVFYNKGEGNFSCSSNFNKTVKDETNFKKFEDENEDFSKEFFEIFGLKLYFDDLLIIALLFFLYQEDVKDTYLYIALILLLLS